MKTPCFLLAVTVLLTTAANAAPPPAEDRQRHAGTPATQPAATTNAATMALNQTTLDRGPATTLARDRNRAANPGHELNWMAGGGR